jgi:hypothetical protein
MPAAAIPKPLRFHCSHGRILTGNWEELGLACYSGGLKYSQSFELADVAKPLCLDLGRVRGTAEVNCNGKHCGTRIWSPYRFDISNAVAPGINSLEITVFNTLAPWFGPGHPSVFGFPSQCHSGIMGPVRILTV